MRHSGYSSDQPPRRLKRLQVPVHVAVGTQAIGVLSACQQRRQVVTGRQHDASRRFVAVGPVFPRVALQATDALQQHVHRAEIGNQQVGVDVQRLLQCLRAHHDAAAGLAVLAQQPLYCVIQQPAVANGEAAMMQRRDAMDAEQKTGVLRAGQLLECLLRLDGIAHGVAHHQHLGTGAGCFQGASDSVGEVRHHGQRRDGYGLLHNRFRQRR